MSEATVESVAEKSVEETPRIKTAMVEFNGDHYTVDKDALDDVYIIEWITDMEDDPDNNGGNIIHVLRKIVGKDQWKKFLVANESESGRVTMQTMSDFSEKIFKVVGAEK